MGSLLPSWPALLHMEASSLASTVQNMGHAHGYGVAQVSQEDCAEGLLKRIARKDCLVGLSGCLMGSQVVSQVGVSYAAYAGLRLGSRLWVLGICRHGLGDKKNGGVSARVGGLRARLVWEGAARGALAACAAERRALCAAGQRGGGVGAHARRINTACPRRSSSRNAVSVTEDEFSTKMS